MMASKNSMCSLTTFPLSQWYGDELSVLVEEEEDEEEEEEEEEEKRGDGGKRRWINFGCTVFFFERLWGDYGVELRVGFSLEVGGGINVNPAFFWVHTVSWLCNQANLCSTTMK